ncbi:chromatin-remodeling ATPase INO80 [Frieseomelitta varia]|nr:chromatin-remodeling ATPase INO80 [Frieseomelitta varia]
MTTMDKMDTSLPFMLKQEQKEFEDTDDDNTSLEDINHLLSISIPSLSANKFHIPTDPNDEFLRLSTTVRAVYFSYLHKCLLTNYILCYKEKDGEIPSNQLKMCANQMELLAVRSSLEATLYRQNILKLISDVKSHTSEKKAYKKLVIFLETPPSKVDIGVQTNNSWAELQKVDNIQSICITSNSKELPAVKETSRSKKEDVNVKTEDCIDDISSQLTVCNNTASPTINSTSFNDIEHNKINDESDEETYKMIVNGEETVEKEHSNIFNYIQDNSNTQVANQFSIQMDDENSQDSLLQHMENMFCDSDDSSDLTTLIEKHSGVTKANMDKEINALLPYNSNGSIKTYENNKRKSNSGKNTNMKASNTRKYSFSYYKEMKNRESNKLSVENETLENKQKRRINSIWFVERVYQVSKLKAKMTELFLKNYRKHERVKEKFIELFGETDDEMMPDSPICIEEHLTACKERIAPWIVKHLMPFYKKRRIKNRQLFKVVAKHIADMLIIENTFPEQDCVSKYIETYFKNKKFIRTKQDVYL